MYSTSSIFRQLTNAFVSMFAKNDVLNSSSIFWQVTNGCVSNLPNNHVLNFFYFFGSLLTVSLVTCQKLLKMHIHCLLLTQFAFRSGFRSHTYAPFAIVLLELSEAGRIDTAPSSGTKGRGKSTRGSKRKSLSTPSSAKGKSKTTPGSSKGAQTADLPPGKRHRSDEDDDNDDDDIDELEKKAVTDVLTTDYFCTSFTEFLSYLKACILEDKKSVLSSLARKRWNNIASKSLCFPTTLYLFLTHLTF